MSLIRDLLLTSIILLTFSCNNGDDDSMVDPSIETDVSSYVFARNGVSSVDIKEQIELAQILESIIEYTQVSYTGEIVEARLFRAAFENSDNNGTSLIGFDSDASLEENLFSTDLSDDYFGDLFEQAAIASKSGNQAAEFTPGLAVRESIESNIIVNNLGQELAQFIEKGVMGSVFLHQMLNVHLTDPFVGDTIDNVILVDDNEYTALEHNWDIAFGYFSAPGDFRSNWPNSRAGELQYWSAYSNLLDPLLGSNDRIMDAFRNGRNAIVNGDLNLKNSNRDILYTELELLSAAATIHYINEATRYLDQNFQGDLLYSLSAAYMFARSLSMNPQKEIPAAQLHNILNVDLGNGGNFWSVTQEGLEAAKEKLVLIYPSLEDVQDDL